MATLTEDKAKEYIKANVSCLDFLEKSKGNMYCCPDPKCNSGHGRNATGAVKYYADTNTWYCHSCKAWGDVINLYEYINGVDYNQAVRELAESCNIEIEKGGYYQSDPAADFKDTPQKATERPQNDFSNGAGVSKAKDESGAQDATGTPGEAQKDFREYYKQCRDNLFYEDVGQIARGYIKNRGITLDNLYDFVVGFDPQADPAKAPGQIKGEKAHPCPRIIIPATENFYIARSIDPDTPAAFKAVNPKKAHSTIFNAAALFKPENEQVFVTEGIFDALSVIEAGEPAISLNSTGNVKKLIEAFEKRPTEATLLISLDNDKPGRDAAEELRAGLARLNINHVIVNIAGEHKDANEALQADREAFFEAVRRAKKKATEKPDNVSLYIDTEFLLDIERFQSDKVTGFNNLDKEAGGLYAGLYVLAAISSLGKTTFAHQIADNIAATGEDVLYFSMEQSRLELVSKSIARTAAQLDGNSTITSIDVRKHGLNTDPKRAAAAAYKDRVKDKLSIIEGNFNCDINFIGDTIRDYCRRYKARPVVFIDYLQILQPGKEDYKSGIRETIDQSVTELKRLSREMELTIIVISSVNRANYLTPIDFESLKESGGIEFTADVVWGLQLQCLNDDLFAKDGKTKEKRDKVRAAKKATPRKIELLCLKNRYGKSSYSCYYNYFAEKDLFTECSNAEIDFTPPETEENPFEKKKPVKRF